MRRLAKTVVKIFLESVGIERTLRIVVFYNICCLIFGGVYIIEAL